MKNTLKCRVCNEKTKCDASRRRYRASHFIIFRIQGAARTRSRLETVLIYPFEPSRCLGERRGIRRVSHTYYQIMRAVDAYAVVQKLAYFHPVPLATV